MILSPAVTTEVTVNTLIMEHIHYTYYADSCLSYGEKEQLEPVNQMLALRLSVEASAKPSMSEYPCRLLYITNTQNITNPFAKMYFEIHKSKLAFAA